MWNIFKKKPGNNAPGAEQQLTELTSSSEETSLIEVSKGMLDDVRKELIDEKTLRVPIAQLSTLGAGIASLIPALNTVTQTTTIDASGLFRIVNLLPGDTLKRSKNDNLWAVLNNIDGGSKLAKLQEVGPLSATSTTTLHLSPAAIMMVVTLAAIERKLDDIIQMQKQILSFLEREKKAEIEADLETLVDIMTKYKHNWDNSGFLASNHKLVLDIQRTARKNMIFYQKNVTEHADNNQFFTTQANLNGDLNKLRSSFQYYRLSMYIYALASLLEIMLSGNFKEAYLVEIKAEIEQQTDTYGKLFTLCSERLKKNSGKSIETLLAKGFGSAVKGLGGLLHTIPMISDGNVDEFLLEGGSKIENAAKDMEGQYVEAFAALQSPVLGSIIDQLQTINSVYNKTSGIYFDAENIYLTQADG